MLAFPARSGRLPVLLFAFLVSILAGIAVPAGAAQPHRQEAARLGDDQAAALGEEARDRKKDSAMHDGGIVMPPAGWLDYCRRNPADAACQAAALTPEHMHDLKEVQSAMWRLPRRSDEQLYHVAEYWVAATGAGGDCEDIALAARARLLQMGWPSGALRLATAWTERGEHHLVLTVDVVRDGALATLVLDSRFPTLQSWQALRRFGYRFESRQSSHGATWVAIEDGGTPRLRDHDVTIASNHAANAVFAATSAAATPTASEAPTR